MAAEVLMDEPALHLVVAAGPRPTAVEVMVEVEAESPVAGVVADTQAVATPQLRATAQVAAVAIRGTAATADTTKL